MTKDHPKFLCPDCREPRTYRYPWEGRTLCRGCYRAARAMTREIEGYVTPGQVAERSRLVRQRAIAGTLDKPRRARVAWDSLPPAAAAREISARARRRSKGDLAELTADHVRPRGALRCPA